MACALNCIADKAAGQLAHKQPLKPELTALRAFVDQLLATAGEQLPSIDAATAAALLHSLARLASTGQVRGMQQTNLHEAGVGVTIICELFPAVVVTCSPDIKVFAGV